LYRYVAFIWNVDDVAAMHAAELFGSRLKETSNWACGLSVPGMKVFVRQPQRHELNCYVLPDGTGIILGRLFPSNLEAWTPTWKATISEQEAKRIAATGGQRLVEDYWGGYVAFLTDSDPADRRCYVIRDCSGKIPCYNTRASDVEVVFADVEDLGRLGMPALTVNWRYVAAFIYASQLQIRETGLNEVTELLAGDCLTLCREYRKQVTIWNPNKICADHVIEDVEQAANRMLFTTQQCISAWASTYKSVLHSLSGGFDSAVVLGCLSRAPSRPSIVCVNRFSDEVGGDERTFARIAAAQAGVRLIERAWDSEGRIDDRLLIASRIVKPDVLGIFGLLDLKIRNELASQVRADAFWTGEGGDHIFFQMKSPLGVADYIHHHGMGRHLGWIVRDAARLAKVSYWSALRTGVALGRSMAPWRERVELEGGGGILSAGVLADQTVGYISHPWTEPTEIVPKGKQYQIHFLAEVVNRERPLSALEYADAHHPLLSQPLMELCLRIPVYLLVKGGRQRGLARTAFGRIVCSEIIERETKGTTTMHTLGLVRDNQRYIASLLLDGLLVRRGILSRQALEPLVLHSRPVRVEQIFPLLSSIAAEVWARTWAHGEQPRNHGLAGKH
jgi:asparagine synthase (glutamine-hydrolysing)